MGIRPSMQKQMLRHLTLVGAAICELGDQFCGSANGRIVARDWYGQQDVAQYTSIDANGLNGALVWDLNRPLVEYDGVIGIPLYELAGAKSHLRTIAELRGKFDIVTDFGTGEHIWNQDQVWRTLHELCKANGYIVFDRPTQGYGGHCFYLLDRSVIAAFCHANNYTPIWIGRALTTRGELLRGILHKRGNGPFVTPQQGRYFKHISEIIGKQAAAHGPDYRSQELIQHALVGKKLPPLADETTDKGIWEDNPDG
jgi:hypothetical protein